MKVSQQSPIQQRPTYPAIMARRVCHAQPWESKMCRIRKSTYGPKTVVHENCQMTEGNLESMSE